MRKLITDIAFVGVVFTVLPSIGACGGFNLSTEVVPSDSDRSEAQELLLTSVLVSAKLSDYEYRNIREKDYTFVRGKLVLKNGTSTNQVVELDSLCLSLGDLLSKGANIDSVAYFLPRIKVDAGQTVEKKVYWVFDGHIPPMDLTGARLITCPTSNK